MRKRTVQKKEFYVQMCIFDQKCDTFQDFSDMSEYIWCQCQCN